MQRFLIYQGKTLVYLNTTTLLLALYMLLLGYHDVLLISYVSICIHEGAHALIASILKHHPSEIEITPMGAMMRLPSECIKRSHMLAIVLSGPTVTVLLCLLAISAAVHHPSWTMLAKKVFLCNSTILLLNMLPCYPLDGGGVLSLILSLLFPVPTVNAVLRTAGRIAGGSILLLCFCLACKGMGLNLSLIMAGCLLIYAAHTATATDALRMLRLLMDRKNLLEQRGYMRCESYALIGSLSVLQAAMLLPAERRCQFLVLESGTMRYAGLLTEEELVAAAISTPSAACADILAKAAVHTLQRP